MDSTKPDKSRQFCVSCIDPLDMAQRQADVGCFELTPIRNGEDNDLLQESAATTSSVMVSSAYTPAGQALPSTLYEWTANGEAVSTKTIATLCGGQAPYFWAPKRLVWQSGWIPEPTFMGALVYTSDGAGYGIAADLSFTVYNNREYIPHEIAVESRLRQRIKQIFFNYLSTAQCTKETESAETMSFVNPHHPALNVNPVWAKSEIAEAVKIIQMTYSWHITLGVPVVYDPVYTNSYYGVFYPVQEEIQIPADLFNQMRTNRFDWKDQRALLEAVIAHEYGHARHFLVAGVNEFECFNYTNSFGLSPRVAWVMQDILLAQQIPAEHWGNFIYNIIANNHLEIDSEYHKPTFSEFVAHLYARDFMTRQHQRSHAAWNEEMLHILDANKIIMDTYCRHVAIFPEVAAELELLYYLMLLDPALTTETKYFGLDLIATMARATPADGRAVWHRPPRDGCKDAAYWAASPEFDPETMLGPRWCDL